MTSYKTLLNGIRTAISKVSTRLKQVEANYKELAYVTVRENSTIVLWSGQLTSAVMEFDVFPALCEGKEYLVTIGNDEYRTTAQKYTDADSEARAFYIGENIFDGEFTSYMVMTFNGGGSIWVNYDLFVGKTMTIRLIRGVTESKEPLPDYVSATKATADNAQATADNAQATADNAQATADNAQAMLDKFVFGFAETIPSYTGNTKIEYAMFPNALKFGSFKNCTSLKEVYIPIVTSIGGSAFSGCTSLESIVLPDSVTSIGGSAFSGCTSLESIVLPDSVTSIGSSAFRNCTGLASISIPEAVKTINTFAFYGCTSLESITFKGTMEQWNAVSKGGRWNANVPATEVICSDGAVSLTT